MKSRSVSCSAAGGLEVPVAVVVLREQGNGCGPGEAKAGQKAGREEGIQTKTPSVNLPPRAAALQIYNKRRGGLLMWQSASASGYEWPGHGVAHLDFLHQVKEGRFRCTVSQCAKDIKARQP